MTHIVIGLPRFIGAAVFYCTFCLHVFLKGFLIYNNMGIFRGEPALFTIAVNESRHSISYNIIRVDSRL